MKKTIALTFDTDALHSYSDKTLMTFWHLAQANPAPYGDRNAEEIVKKLGWEIIRRWLGGVSPEMYSHQPGANAQLWLRKFAKYIPGCRDSVYSRKFYDGEWVPIAEHEERRAAAEAAWKEAGTASREDLAKYPGRVVAIINKQIVADAAGSDELHKYLRDNDLDADGVYHVPADPDTFAMLQRLGA